MNVFELFAAIKLDTSEYERGLDDASDKTSSFGDKVKSFGDSVSNVGSTLTKGVTLPVVGLGAAMIKTSSDYEAGMSKVQAISGATGQEMDMLGNKAMDMASKTKFSTAESAEAYQYMAMAGWDAGQMVDGLSGIMLLASASGENLATTSDIVTDAITAFGLEASDSERFVDVLAAMSNSANTNVSMLGESFKYVAPVAGALGYSVEDTSVALGLMANSGIKASQAGTSLRTAITNMASPTKSMADVMEKYGITLTDVDGNMLSLSEIMVQLREKLGGLDEATQASAASTLFGKEAMSGMLAIVNASPEDFEKLTNSVKNSSGTTEEMAAIMNDNAAGAMAMLSSAVNVLFTKLGELLIPIFTDVVKAVTEVVNWFTGLDEGTQQLILTILGVVAVVGPLLSGLGKVISVVSSVGKVISGLGTVFSLLTNPVGLVIAAIAGIVVAFIALWNKSESFRQFWIGLWEGIKNVISKVADFISGIFKGIGNIIGGFWDWITGKSKSSLDEVETDVKNTWDNVESNTDEKWNSTQGIIAGALTGIQAATDTSLSAIGGSIDTAWKLANTSTETNWQAIAATTGAMSAEACNSVDTNYTQLSSTVDSNLTMAENISRILLTDIARTADAKSGEALTAVTDNFHQMEGAVVNGIVSAKDGANAQDWYSVGTNIVDGMSSGVHDRARDLANAVANTAASALSAARIALDINSPSKKFRDIIGVGIGEGIAVGVDQSRKTVLDSIYKMGDSVLDAFDSSVQPYSITGGVEIRDTGTYKTMYGSDTAGVTGNVTNVTINSPKAVDPVQAAREWKKTTRQIALGFI